MKSLRLSLYIPVELYNLQTKMPYSFASYLGVFYFFFLHDCSEYDFQYYFEWEWEVWAHLASSWSDGNVFTLSLLTIMLTVCLFYMAFIMLKYVLYTEFLEFFILKGYCILSNAFSASETIIWFSFFILLVWHITLIDLCMLNYSYIQK